MNGVILIGVGVIQATGVAALLWFLLKKGSEGVRQALGLVQAALQEKDQLAARTEELGAQLVDFDELRTQVVELKRVREGLKVEKGRVTITHAELETVEGRLRELEEIERELEASGIETKEELKILKRKEKELLGKNESLKVQIQESRVRMEELFAQIELTAQLQTEVDKMRGELLACESQIDVLLMQIEQGNEQYFILKQRYDALDIEYAQLYEKFSEVAPPPA